MTESLSSSTSINDPVSANTFRYEQIALIYLQKPGMKLKSRAIDRPANFSWSDLFHPKDCVMKSISIGVLLPVVTGQFF